MRLSRRGSLPPFDDAAVTAQERVCPHGQGDVAVPGVVAAADLVLVKTDLALGRLETLFHRPAGAGDADQLLIAGICGSVVQVARQFGGSLMLRRISSQRVEPCSAVPVSGSEAAAQS